MSEKHKNRAYRKNGCLLKFESAFLAKDEELIKSLIFLWSANELFFLANPKYRVNGAK